MSPPQHSRRPRLARLGLALLLADRADLGARDAHGRTPLHVATFAAQHEAIRRLVQAGADLGALENDRNDAVTGHAGVVRQLIDAGAPLDHVSNLHGTAMIEAVVPGDGGPRQLATLLALQAAGADARRSDREGRTPLRLAGTRLRRDGASSRAQRRKRPSCPMMDRSTNSSPVWLLGL